MILAALKVSVLGRITVPPNMVLNEQVKELWESLYRSSRDREKRGPWRAS